VRGGGERSRQGGLTPNSCEEGEGEKEDIIFMKPNSVIMLDLFCHLQRYSEVPS